MVAAVEIVGSGIFTLALAMLDSVHPAYWYWDMKLMYRGIGISNRISE